MRVRDYRRSDLERLCEIDRRCFPPALVYTAGDMREILRPGAMALVAENDRGEAVGFAVALGGHIVTVDVLPRYRRRGIAGELLLDLERRLGSRGRRVVRLETAVGNRAAQALYLSLGYTCLGSLPRYYPDGQDALRMEKTLDVRPKVPPRDRRRGRRPPRTQAVARPVLHA